MGQEFSVLCCTEDWYHGNGDSKLADQEPCSQSISGFLKLTGALIFIKNPSIKTLMIFALVLPYIDSHALWGQLVRMKRLPEVFEIDSCYSDVVWHYRSHR